MEKAIPCQYDIFVESEFLKIFIGTKIEAFYIKNSK